MSNRRKKNGRRKPRAKAKAAKARRIVKAREAAQTRVYHLKADIYSSIEEANTTLQVDSPEELADRFYWTCPNDFRRCSIDGHPCSPAYFYAYLEEQRVKSAIRQIRYSIPQEIIILRGVVDRGDHLVINSPPGKGAFFKKFEELGADTTIEVLYHGTPAENITSILQDGFRLSSGGALGRGLYLGPMSKAIGYTGGNRWRFWRRNAWRTEEKERLCRDTVIECEVLLGRCNRPDQTEIGKTSPQSSGFDTLYYDGFRNPEYCVKSVNQVLIKRIMLLPKHRSYY